MRPIADPRVFGAGIALAITQGVEQRFLIVLALVLAATTSLAHADSRVVVRSFSGPNAAAVRRAVVKDLAHAHVKVVDEAAAERVAKRRGVSLGGALGKKEVARELAVSAWVEGRIVRRGGKMHAKISVEDARLNNEVQHWDIARKKPKQLEPAMKGVGGKIANAIDGLTPPESEYTPPSQEEGVEEEPTPEPTPAPAVPVAQSRDEELPPSYEAGESSDGEFGVDGDEAEPRDGKLSAAEVNVGMGMMSRSLSYNDAYSQNVGDYKLPAAPVADLGVRFFPGTLIRDTREGWPAYIGLDLRAQLGFALASQASDGTRYDTSYHAFSASLLGRYPIKRHEVHAALGFGAQSFRVKDKGDKEAPVPDVDYKAARLGAGGRYAALDWLTLGGDLTYLFITSVGELAAKDWFPGATGGGIEAQLYADARVWGPVDARLYAGYQRQFFDFHSKPGDNRVAGGAVDGYFTAGIGLGYTY